MANIDITKFKELSKRDKIFIGTFINSLGVGFSKGLKIIKELVSCGAMRECEKDYYQIIDRDKYLEYATRLDSLNEHN